MSVWSDADWEAWVALELWRHTGETDTYWWRMQWQYERSQQRRRERKATGQHQADKAERKRRRYEADALAVKSVVLAAGGTKQPTRSGGSSGRSSTDQQLQHEEDLEQKAEQDVEQKHLIEIEQEQEQDLQHEQQDLEQKHEQGTNALGRWMLLE